MEVSQTQTEVLVSDVFDQNKMMALLIINALSLFEQILLSIWLCKSHKSCLGIQIRPPTVTK